MFAGQAYIANQELEIREGEGMNPPTDFADGWYIIEATGTGSYTPTAIRAGILAPFASFSSLTEARAFIAGFKAATKASGRMNLGDLPPQPITQEEED